MTKRLFDIIFALLGIIALSPVYLTIAIIIKCNSPGPVLYRGVRSGLGGRHFRIMKFRTMVADAEMVGGFSTALNDKRLTSIGKELRKYKLDELPQLINVLKGDMSFVGPRPEIPEYASWYDDEEKIILTVPPGITDYASLRFINLGEILGDENVDEVYEKQVRPLKNQLRVKYVRERSFRVDMQILFATLIKIVTRR